MGEMDAGTVASPPVGHESSSTEKIWKPETFGCSAASAIAVTATEETLRRVDEILSGGQAKDCDAFKKRFSEALSSGRFTQACCAINEIDPLLTQTEWHCLMDLMDEKSLSRTEGATKSAANNDRRN